MVLIIIITILLMMIDVHPLILYHCLCYVLLSFADRCLRIGSVLFLYLLLDYCFRLIPPVFDSGRPCPSVAVDLLITPHLIHSHDDQDNSIIITAASPTFSLIATAANGPTLYVQIPIF